MKWFDLKAKNRKKKQQRFRRPEFQEKLEQARRFARKQEPKRKGFSFSKLLPIFGLGNKWVRLLLLFIVLGAIYFFTISRMFLVKDIQFVGDTSSQDEILAVLQDMQKERTFLIPKNHILLLGQEKFEQVLKQEIPEIKAVSQYRRIWPDRIQAEIERRVPSYVWQSGNEYFLLDQDGVVFRQILNYQPTVYSELLIQNTIDQEVVLGQPLGTEQLLTFLEVLLPKWPELISQTSIAAVSVPGKDSADAFIRTGLGFVVVFDLKRGPGAQLANLQLLLNQEIDPQTYPGLAYIDLRLPDVAYYCYQDAPCAGEGGRSE